MQQVFLRERRKLAHLSANLKLSLERCAVICHISPMALYRLVCALGQQSLVAVLTRCALPLPVYLLVDEKHTRCLTEKVYLPTIVSGRAIWHLGYSDSKSAVAFTESYGVFQRAAAAVHAAHLGAKVRAPAAALALQERLAINLD